MTLQVITVGGIKALCSEVVVNRYQELFLLAIAGYQATVKGIIACALEGKTVMSKIDGDYYNFKRAPEYTYSVHYQKLPSGLAEGIIVPDIAFPGCEKEDQFMVLAEAKPRELFFRHLDERTEIPLHLSWTNWLWDTFLQREWLTPLETPIGIYQGYIVNLFDEELRESIAEAIAYQIPDIMACFEKGNIDET